MKKVIEYLEHLKITRELSGLLESANMDISVKTLSGSLKSLVIASLWLKKKRNYLIITPSAQEAEDWFHDLQLVLGDDVLALLSEPSNKVHYTAENQDEQLIWLIDGLSVLQKNDFSITISTPDIFNISIPKHEEISKYRTTLHKGQFLEYSAFSNMLGLNGFERVDFVSSQGEMAVRGGIVDIFPLGWDNPLRIEFWDNEIESIREFQPISQRSIREHQSIEFIANIYHSSRTTADSTIFEYLSNDTILVLDNPDSLQSSIDNWDIFSSYQKLSINKLGEADVKINSSQQKQYHGSVKDFTLELRKLVGLNAKIVISAQGKEHLERLKELVENGIEMSEVQDTLNSTYLAEKDVTLNSILWLNESFTHGFLLPDFQLAIFTEHEIFNRLRTQTTRRGKRITGGISLRELMQLKIGDFVVHVDKGVGKFDGFKTIKLGVSLQDCLRLQFADDDILYVNLNYINKIQKYSSQEGVVPKLSKLGSTEWLRKKAKTKKRLKDIARDLIKLYAERKRQPGISYPSDTMWQKEFEASFIYDDTPDQAQTTTEVKKDMESETPMDRLVCGDVGFGKTEIAIRASFKAVQAGKQVAVLVPTTILAQQHYMTFMDRLHRYPVIIEVISRFRSKKEQEVVVEKTKNAQIDVLIGTHRLLSKDVSFRNLGLLVIDEEHRFGVASKEKLRKLRTNVDTLTLTATPIPRTLNFSLMGARDLSIIETPPRNRLPIYTEILEWNDKIILKAISKEIERKGQVFFVNDKIQDIEKISRNIQMLMPSLKVAVAHGQMRSSELEHIMEKFLERKFDVLFTTKIIESGIDIPNANTMFINNAQNFGLAELYQLRGRVGRSNIQAYCYLLIPPVKNLSSNSLRRLQAIEEFTELGSGLQLAMRDMEIRGAGNLLGPEQSGYINEIGFELYQRILDEAVSELKIEEFSELFFDSKKIDKILPVNEDITIELDSDALLPSDYIASETERFHFYKKLYHVRDNDALHEILEEMNDRFGKLPQQANELIFAVKLRVAALSSGFAKITLKKNKLSAEFLTNLSTDFQETVLPVILDLLPSYPNAKIFQNENKLSIELLVSKRDDAVEFLWRIKRTLQSLID
ncbi:MAG: transcription-repair coupling factor [Ignavibacteria bacterium GWB2_35_12]|nr:MAG: transcription-repair coupling factor [Ignavibacteria bacterium GWB2_35_12]OGU88542.1 MAG: transcription-repair coupling factor [Ignavibacteria bacterium RIFOXYA2_FULL_35_10]OGV20307.1 MAG: transcription-repair coupling factor [Ignavibacteria bacterium RIFOXYC2_FULL_35_21]